MGQSPAAAPSDSSDLDVLAADPHDDEDLLDQADEPQRTGVARQPAQLHDQLVQVVRQVLVERLDERLAVLAVGGDDEVDLVVRGVLEVVVVQVVGVVVRSIVDRRPLVGIAVGAIGSWLVVGCSSKSNDRIPRRRTPT